jgi:hypothetical protein
VQSADYRSITCSVVSQKESSLRRQLQTTEHKAEVTYRTNGIDLLVLVFGIVNLPQDVSFQSVVYQTFFTFKAEFQQDLNSVSDFFEKPDTSGQSAATDPEITTTSSGKSFFGGAGKGLYIGAAALIGGGLLALSISFFVLRRREDDSSTRETPRHAKEDASANHLSIRVQSEDEMLPLSPIGFDAMRPPPLDMEPGVEEEAVEGDESDSSESKSEPVLNQYSPRGPTNQPAMPLQSPRVSPPEDSGRPMGTSRGDIESQDASSSEEDMGWRRLLYFGKRKRSIDKPPLQQQRDIGISPNQSTVESVLADWTQGSLGTAKGHEHVLIDLDKLAEKKSAASTPKYDNTSTKSPQW